MSHIIYFYLNEPTDVTVAHLSFVPCNMQTYLFLLGEVPIHKQINQIQWLFFFTKDVASYRNVFCTAFTAGWWVGLQSMRCLWPKQVSDTWEIKVTAHSQEQDKKHQLLFPGYPLSLFDVFFVKWLFFLFNHVSSYCTVFVLICLLKKITVQMVLHEQNVYLQEIHCIVYSLVFGHL